MLPSHFNSCSGARVPGLSRFRKTVGSLHRSTLPYPIVGHVTHKNATLCFTVGSGKETIFWPLCELFGALFAVLQYAKKIFVL